jgi:hypothetical protein
MASEFRGIKWGKRCAFELLVYVAYAALQSMFQGAIKVSMPHHRPDWRQLDAVALACFSSIEEVARAASYDTPGHQAAHQAQFMDACALRAGSRKGAA